MGVSDSFSSYIHNSSEVILVENCSYYLIPYGTLQIVTDQNVTMNFNYSNLPGVYITNCTVNESVYSEILAGLTSTEILDYTMDDFVSGLVSLSFVLSAVCVSSWMLLVLLRLSPHKKPFWTEITCLYHTAALTVLLTKTTSFLDMQYHEDSLDIYLYKTEITNSVAFNVVSVIFQILLYISWTQIMIHVLKYRYKRKIIAASSFTIVAGIILWCVYVFYRIDENYRGSMVVKVLKYFFQLLLSISYSLGVLYTTIKKRRYSYQKRILPLAFCNIILLVIHPIFAIFEAYSSEWFGTWCLLLRTLSDVSSCVMIWEWIAATEELEKRTEIVGVLGRKVSDDDILVYEDREGRDNKLESNILKNLLNFRKRKGKTMSEPEEVSLYELVETEAPSINTDEASEYRATLDSRQYFNDDSITDDRGLRHSAEDIEVAEFHLSDFDDDPNDEDGNGSGFGGMVDEFEIRGQGEGTSASAGAVDTHSSGDNPPPFEVHPGFQIGDYWDDEKNAHDL